VRHARLCFVLALLSIGQAFAQTAIADWFPFHLGDKWIYEHQTRDDDGGPNLEIEHWTTEETIVGSWTVPEGTLIGRQVRVVEGSPGAGYRADPNPAYLIRGDCLYLSYVGWQPRDHQLTPAFRRDLLAGQIAADFCFPLAVGKTWGARTWGAKDWQVAGLKVRDQSAPDKKNTFHVTSASSYLGSGMTADIWFEKGVGVVRQDEIHHGTIGETRILLLRFEPASRR
jgi:hypothetical protein